MAIQVEGLKRIGVWLAVAALLGGCGKNSEPDFCKDFLGALASKVSDCGGGPSDLVQGQIGQGVFGDDVCTNLAKAVANGHARYDSSKADGCIDSIKSASCFTALTASSADCKAVITGTVETGGACIVGSVDCQGVDSSCTNTSTSPICSGTCEATVPAGGSCAGDKASMCSSDTDCVNDVCTARPPPTLVAAGGSCGPDACQDGLLCENTSHTCKAFVREGGAWRAGQGLCEGFTSCVSGKCTRFNGVGGSCGTANNERAGCLGKSFCKASASDPNTGTCTALLAVGSPCSGNDCDGYCNGSTCAAVPATCNEP